MNFLVLATGTTFMSFFMALLVGLWPEAPKIEFVPVGLSWPDDDGEILPDDWDGWNLDPPDHANDFWAQPPK